MKVAGVLIWAESVLLTTLLFLFPTSISVLGFSASCGTPVVSTFQGLDPLADGTTRELQLQCRSQSQQRVLAGAGVGVVGAALGAFLLATERRTRRRAWQSSWEATRYPA